MVWEELRDSLCDIRLDVSDYEGVMQHLGATLIKEGYAKKSYVEALISREKEYPTGLNVDGFGVAIPHTDIQHVIRGGIAIGILKNPVTFIQMGSDDEEVDVQIIFMLAVANPNEHIENLQKIITIIQDKEILIKLSKVSDSKEIIEIIKQKEMTL